MYKLIKDFLTPNKYSRPASKIKKINCIVIHWITNHITSEKANMNSLK